MRARTGIATTLGRTTSWALRRVFRRSASQLPGRIALTIAPNLLNALADKLSEGAIVVCGTNGKTTTNNIIASCVEGAGNTVLCNRLGANMLSGVTAAMLPRHSADWAVMESDELSTIHILPALHPRYLVLLNLFRDQLDRAGEIDHVQDVIVEALAASPTTALIVNGDDPISMGVAVRAQAAGTKVISFGIGEDLHLPPERVPEDRFCQVCGAELTYDYRTYAQLGAFKCPTCSFARPELDFYATDVHVDREGVSFTAHIRGGASQRIEAPFGGVYMVYNLLAALAAASLAGCEAQSFQHTLSTYHPQNGRLQHFVVDGREVVLNLAKNPAGFNQNISLMLADDREKAALFLINDNGNDGKDISWIWDVDFERLAGEGVRALAGGIRRNDVQVRMKYAGLPATLAESVADGLAQLEDVPSEQPLYVLANYSALFPAKVELEMIGESV